MVALKRVLCPVDLSELSIDALACSGSIAGKYRSELIVLHVVPSFEPMEVRAGALFDPVRFVYPMRPEGIEAQLRDAMRMAGVTMDRARVAARAGEPGHVIVNEALATEADLVVVATHGRTGWNRLMLGSVAEHVLRTAPCSIVTVPAVGAHPSAWATISAVLCPVDFSPDAEEAAAFAVDLANRAAASVKFLHVIEWLPEDEARHTAQLAEPPFPPYRMIAEREQLAALIGRLPPVEKGVTTEVTAGLAHPQITRIASAMKADVIVLGAHGRGAPAGAALGRTTEHVVRAAPCPVLTVRPSRGHTSEQEGLHVPGL
jgi:nucleotide-binding universal stress UspA family protein